MKINIDSQNELEQSLKLEEGTQFFHIPGEVKLAFDFIPSTEKTQHILFLVNGFQRNRQDFRAFRRKLKNAAPSVATVSFDNRYSPGETETHSSSLLNMADIAQDLLLLVGTFLKKCEISSWSVLGISMGGMIAQIAALQAPLPQPEYAFFVSTTAGGPSRVFPPRVTKGTQLQYTPYENPDHVQRSMKRYFGQKFLASHPLAFQNMCQSIWKQRQNPSPHANPQEQFRESLSFDVEKYRESTDISSIQFVLMSGDEDGVIPVENIEALKAVFSRSHVHIYPGVGHLLLLEIGDLFLQDVVSYLSV